MSEGQWELPTQGAPPWPVEIVRVADGVEFPDGGGSAATQVEGRAADNTAAVGNPVLIGILDPATGRVQTVQGNGQGYIFTIPGGTFQVTQPDTPDNFRSRAVLYLGTTPGAYVSDTNPVPIVAPDPLDVAPQDLQIGGSAVDAMFNPVPIAPSRGPLTNLSGTIAAGGVSQQVAADNAQRKYFIFQNTSGGVLYLNFGNDASDAGGSFAVYGGGSFVMENSFVSDQSIHVYGNVAGQTYTAKEG